MNMTRAEIEAMRKRAQATADHFALDGTVINSLTFDIPRLCEFAIKAMGLLEEFKNCHEGDRECYACGYWERKRQEIYMAVDKLLKDIETACDERSRNAAEEKEKHDAPDA